MRVLVTGASGFVGAYVVKELESKGHTVLGADRMPTVSGGLYADMTKESEVHTLIERAAPEAVVHLAGWSHIGKSWEDPATVFHVNVDGSIKLFKAFSSFAGSSGRFLYVSSASVYGLAAPEFLPLSEASPTAPDSPYACSRLAAEQILTMLARHAGTDLLIARPFNHIGRGQHPSFACPSFARRVAAVKAGRAEVVRHGNLAARRDFLHVSDVAHAYRLILEKGRGGDLFVIGSGQAHSMEEILLRMFKLAGIPARHEVAPEFFRPVDCEELRADSHHLRKVTGWRPVVSLDATLNEILTEAEEA